MGVFEMIAFVVGVSVIGGVIMEWIKSKKHKPANLADNEKIKELENRITNLERILTDNRESLKREIDAL